MHTLTFEIPRWSQDGPRLPNSLQMAPKLTQNVSQNQCFWDSFSMNYAMLSDIPSRRKHKWSNTNPIMPTSTKKTHTTQRGVGGMRRRPGKFQDPSIQDEPILSSMASNGAEPKDAIRQLIFLWAGWRDPANINIFWTPHSLSFVDPCC